MQENKLSTQVPSEDSDEQPEQRHVGVQPFMQSDCSGQYGLQVLRLLVSELQGPHLFTSGRVNRLLTPSKYGGLYLQEVAISKPTEVLENQRLHGELKCAGWPRTWESPKYFHYGHRG